MKHSVEYQNLWPGIVGGGWCDNGMRATDELVGLLDELLEQRREVARGEARLAAQLVEFVDARRASDKQALAAVRAAGREPRHAPGEFAADELSLATKLSVYEVQCLVAMTRRIQSRLPSVWDAWCAGDLDRDRVRLIDKALRRLVADVSVARLDEQVVAKAVGKTGKQLRSWLERFVAYTEPELHQQRHVVALSERYASARPGLDGTGLLTAVGSTLDVTAADQRLADLAYACGADDPRSMDQRRADVFFDLLLGRTGDGRSAVTTAIGVVVPITSLVGDSAIPGALSDRSGTVPASVVEHLATQRGTLFYRLLTDPAGQLLDVAEQGRFPSTKLGWALDFRAGTCVFPTCTVPATGCDHDHHVPVPDGETAGWNLDPECRRQHRAKTHAGFSTSRDGPQVSVTTPTGHTYTRVDDPLHVEGWATDPAGEENREGDAA